jgi:signal transduction histidine kinase
MGVKLLVVSTILLILLRRTVLVRLRRLMDVTRELTAGNYVVRLDEGTKDELGELTRAFNLMASDLRHSREQIESHNRELESRVTLATAKLQQAYEDLKNTQGQLVLNEKMASLGGLIAGVAHEINTPVGAILNVTRTLEKRLTDLPRNLEGLRSEDAPSTQLMIEFLEALREGASASRSPASLREQRAVEEVLREAGITQWQERSATLCRFHFVDAQRVRRHLPCIASEASFGVAESYASIVQAAMISQTGSQKIAEIVRALKYYAYSDNARVDQLQINESIGTALVLLRNQLKHAVQTTTDYASDLPPIPCTSDIHQVWTNLLVNACDAIAEKGEGHDGRIEIRTRRQGNLVVVAVTDNGVGIPAQAMDRIFDPFYTTKDIGKGTGLGLSIVSGIVKSHGGSIRVESEPGHTTFEVFLPIEQAIPSDRTKEVSDDRAAA